MPWLPRSQNSAEPRSEEHEISRREQRRLIEWAEFTEPRTLVSTLVLTASSLAAIHLYRTYLRRIPEAASIQTGFFRRRSLFGRVTSVGDGDNFRMFHTPGGRLAGWDWFPGRKVPRKREGLKDRTIHVRLAGVDAPELAHFGRPAQPYALEALEWLRGYVLHRRVRAYIYKRDQYDRVVSTVYVRRWLLRRDVGLQMIKQGLATVYEAKTGAEFGAVEEKYRQAEAWAKKKRRGMWSGRNKDFESPRDYKTRMALLDEKAHLKR